MKAKVRKGIPESSGYRTFQIINYIILTILAVFCLLPMINVLAISFSSSLSVAAGEVRMWPIGFNTTSYKFVFENKQFWISMLVSIKRVIIGGGLGIVLTIITAYPLSKDPKVFKARTKYVWFIFFTMLFSGGLIPGYLMVTWTKLYNTIWALIIPGAISAWNCILMLNFFRQLPKELEEAAYIDGAGHWTILWKIVVPISKPVIATVLLFIVVGHWNDWFGGYLYMSQSKKYPMQTYLYSLISIDITQMTKYNVDPEAIKKLSAVSNKTLSSAQIFVGALPILLVYPFLQKYFTKGIVLGSVKG
jgi:putative aldouronate transport system permease protein